MTTTACSIQPVSNSEEIIAIIHAGFQRYATDIPSSAMLETAALIDQQLQNGVEIFGAYVDDTLAGVVKMKEQDGLYFYRLAVDPIFQKRGIGSALMEHLKTVAAQRQLGRLHCTVRASEPDNIRFYQRLGFSIISEDMTTSPAGVTMPTYHMVYTVTQ